MNTNCTNFENSAVIKRYEYNNKSFSTPNDLRTTRGSHSQSYSH